MRKAIILLMVSVCLAVMIYSGFNIYKEHSEYQKGEDTYKALEPDFEEEPDSANESKKGRKKIKWPKVDFKKLYKKNHDIVAWLYAKDTVINYPVVQTKDNDYYLNHLFNREKNKCGCIFMDAANRSDFSSPNTIIYGHHMRNGSMFGSLEKYKDKKYYKKHKTLLLMTKEKKYIIKIYAGYLCSQNEDAWRMDFKDEEDWNTWVQHGINRSTFKNDIVPEYDDHVVTLSTCAYDFKNARYVLHGILEEKYD